MKKQTFTNNQAAMIEAMAAGTVVKADKRTFNSLVKRGVLTQGMLDANKAAQQDTLTEEAALVAAEAALELAFNLNMLPQFERTPCCNAFDLAEALLNKAGLDGAEVVHMAVDCGEYFLADLQDFVQQIADKAAQEAAEAAEDAMIAAVEAATPAAWAVCCVEDGVAEVEVCEADQAWKDRTHFDMVIEPQADGSFLCLTEAGDIFSVPAI